MAYFFVFVGAGIGGAFRHGVNVLAGRVLGATVFPFGTLSINVLGSFLMGIIAEWLALKSGGSSQHLRLFLTTGILGGFTTFSAFSLEAALLYERGDAFGAATYILASVVLSIGALFAGLSAIRLLVNGGG